MTQLTGESLPLGAIAAAQLLVGAVHEEGPAEVAALLTPLDRQALYGLAVTLAAMVPADYTPGELLAWNDVHELRHPGNKLACEGRTIQPCGTHAAFNRHRAKGEQPCDECWVGERRYQREKKERQRRERRLQRQLSMVAS